MIINLQDEETPYFTYRHVKISQEDMCKISQEDTLWSRITQLALTWKEIVFLCIPLCNIHIVYDVYMFKN